ncbi:unnamed protein product, partial [Pylaiella littoralis]
MLLLTVGVVPGTERGPIFYKVIHERDGRSWTVTQRFSTLDAMRHALWKNRLPLPVERFPEKQAPLARLMNKWQSSWAPATPAAMPPDEMEERRSGLQVYLSSLSKLEESWQSDIVTKVLCAEEEQAPAAATDQPDAGQNSSTSRPKSVSWVDQQTLTAALTAVATEPVTHSQRAALVSPPPPTPSSALSVRSAASPKRPADDAEASGASSPAARTVKRTKSRDSDDASDDRKVADDQQQPEQPPSTSPVVSSDDPSSVPAPVATNDEAEAEVAVAPAAAPLAAVLPAADSDPNVDAGSEADSVADGTADSTTDSKAAIVQSPPERETDTRVPATAVADATALTSLPAPHEPHFLSQRLRDREQVWLKKSLEAAEAGKTVEGVPAAAHASVSATHHSATATPPASAGGSTVVLPSFPAIAPASSSRCTVAGVGETAAVLAVSPEIIVDASEEVAAGQDQTKQAAATGFVPAAESGVAAAVRSVPDQPLAPAATPDLPEETEGSAASDSDDSDDVGKEE